MTAGIVTGLMNLRSASLQYLTDFQRIGASMTLITAEQAAVISRQIELQLASGNLAAADSILQRAIEEAKKSAAVQNRYGRFEDVPISELNFSTNCARSRGMILSLLDESGYRLVGDLAGVRRDYILTIPGFGWRSADLLMEALRDLSEAFDQKTA